jgi:CheY-like chemotaxis protein
MNGIIGMTGLALDTELDPEQRDYLEMVKESADSLLAIINDILDFSKIEAGKLNIDHIDFSLSDVITGILRPMAVRANQRGVAMNWHIEPDVPEFIKGDPFRLRQILGNLAGNALKFTEKGEVALRVAVEKRLETEVCLHFELSDTGIGIPADKQAVIFEAFAQADGSTTRKYGGTGLGLTITSQLLELVGGKLWLQSPAPNASTKDAGPGSVFHFTINFEIGRANSVEVELSEPHVNFSSRKLNILLAEDNLINQRLAVGLLEKQGHTIHVAGNGREALDAFRNGQFDLILLDVQMPEVNGFEAAKAIREDDRLTGKHTPIIAMTAYAMEGDRESCLEAGMDSYVAKPIIAHRLFNAIDELLRPVSAPSAVAQQQTECESFDTSSLLTFAAGDEELANNLIEIFLEDSPAMLQVLREAVEHADAPAIERTAHTLKGTLGYFGNSHAETLSSRLQQMAATNDLSAASETFIELEHAMDELTRSLSDHVKVYAL